MTTTGKRVVLANILNLAYVRRSKSLHHNNETQDSTSLWLRCPACRCQMEEPRLLDCLHPICTNCVQLLRNGDWPADELSRGCPVCEYPLPGIGSSLPPPHYPLQHRLLMIAVRTRRIKCFCDTCHSEIEASLHCATCLRNYCNDCGKQHRMKARGRLHEIVPIWRAKRFRKMTVCLEHPDHPLRFFCIACQKVTCSECMWRDGNHRGHASEGHTEAAKTAVTLLSNTLKSAGGLLDDLLLRYTSKSFSNYSARFSHSHTKAEEQLLYAKEARDRIDEFLRLRNARNLLDAISLTEQLLAEGSDAEILSLSRIILKRFQILGLNIRPRSEHVKQNFRHSGIFHCCTFCSSGGRKEAECACQGTMPGGYKGCGHGHPGHPRARHWSCCGSTDRYSVCPQWHSPSYKITL